MPKPVVLLVEDDGFMRGFLTHGLAGEGYEVTAVATAAEFTQQLARLVPDIMLIDLVLPDGDGLDLMAAARRKTDVPAIIISGRTGLADKVAGLEHGADDYVSKPVQMQEIAARVKAQLRRYQSMKDKGGKAGAMKSQADRLAFGSWILDRPRMQVLDGQGVPLYLSPSEFRLVEALVLSSNRVLSRAQLLDHAHSADSDVTDRAIDMQILRIRRKLGDKPGPDSLIRAVRGIGYMCTAETSIA